MRKQYHLRRAETGFDAWDVDHLIALSRHLPPTDVPLADIPEIDTTYWFDDADAPTVRAIAAHAQLIAEVDTRWPIILDHEGRVMDGMHRVARALLEGRTSIRAVRLTEPVQPTHRNCDPDSLPYDEC